jgi:hypothetical protein
MMIVYIISADVSHLIFLEYPDVFLETHMMMMMFSVPLQIAIDDVFATHTQKTENVVIICTMIL